MRNDARPMGRSQVADHKSPVEDHESAVAGLTSQVEPTERARDSSERKKRFVTDRDPGDEEESSR